uniref:Uncharacterized protein n=1 Tax=Anguilla anguilla TaxID=7936 RepID=A0A0E9QAB3_ANGAN
MKGGHILFVLTYESDICQILCTEDDYSASFQVKAILHS